MNTYIVVSGGNVVVSTGIVVVSTAGVSIGIIEVSVPVLSESPETLFVELHPAAPIMRAPAQARFKINFFIGLNFNYLTT